jgi:hypothetical protein
MLTMNPVKTEIVAPAAHPSHPPIDIPMRSRIRFTRMPSCDCVGSRVEIVRRQESITGRLSGAMPCAHFPTATSPRGCQDATPPHRAP